MGMMLTVQCANNNNGGGRVPGDDIVDVTSMELTGLMGAGWNLGNTLDAHWNDLPWGIMQSPSQQETLWGNPVTTKAMIDKIKESGFNTVRVPVTWYMFTGPGPNYNINAAWMNRVQEVIDYVIDNGMFCILNTHHEDFQSGFKNGQHWEVGWLRLYHHDGNDSRPLNDFEKENIDAQLRRIWEQIAARFKDYDEYLIFEGVNEPRTIGLENITNEVWREQSNFLNELLQSFIDTVRASGGRNADRHLMVTPYFASVGMNVNDNEGRIGLFVDKASGTLRVNDPRDRLIVSLHYYEPWGFVTAPHDSPWHSWFFDLNVSSVSHNIDSVLRIIDNNFISKGIPVIMGETGAIHRNLPDGQSNEAERVKWARNYISRLKALGVPSVIWDDGGAFQLLDRASLEWKYPDLAAAFVEASQPQ